MPQHREHDNRRVISRDELRQRLAAGATGAGGELFLFEVLPEPYYRKHHLPGAVHMPPDRVIETAQRVVGDYDAEIVVYCWDDH